MLRFALILTMCFLYIIDAFIANEQMSHIYSILTVIVFFATWLMLEKRSKIFTLSLLVIGMVIHYTANGVGLNLFQGITQNMPLLAILILAPLLSVPLKREGIIGSTVSYLDKLKDNPRNIFYGLSTVMVIVAPILNMGALRIVHGLVENLKIDPKVLSKSYYIGFTPAIIWSPFFASVGIVIFYLDITYLSYLPVGISFALIQLVCGIILFRPASLKKQGSGVLGKSEIGARQKKHVFMLISYVFFIIILLISLEQWLHKSMLLLVSIICLTVPMFWFIIRGSLKILKNEYFLYKDKVLTQTKTEICLFLSAGVFGNAISNTPVKEIIEQTVQWASLHSVGILFIFIVVCVTLLAMVGVHQIIIIPLILTALISANINVDPLLLAFMCIFSWMFSAAISPLNALNIIISSCVKRNGITVAYKWNGTYFLFTSFAALTYVYVLNFLLS